MSKARWSRKREGCSREIAQKIVDLLAEDPGARALWKRITTCSWAVVKRHLEEARCGL